jgi:hypothetical protein
MSGKLPLFASAPLCTIEIKEGASYTKIAYAVGLNLNVGISLQEIRVLGQFEVESIEPVAMMPVTGSFQVIRLLKESTREANRKATATDKENSLVRLKDEVKDVKGLAKDAVIPESVLSEKGAGALTGSTELAKHLDPRTILLSKSFDIKINMKVPSVKVGAEWKQGTEVVFMEVLDCRLSGASANITPSALLTESVEFQGLLAVRTKNNARVEAASTKVKDL